jgi:hypothetical protein
MWATLSSRVDRAIEESRKAGHIAPALRVITELMQGAVVNVSMLGKALYESYELYRSLGFTRPAFFEQVALDTGMSQDTAEMHMGLWEKLNAPGSKVPKEYRDRLLTWGPNTRKKMVEVIDRVRDKRVWHRLTSAENHSAVVKQVRRILEKPDPTPLSYVLRDNGTFEAWQGGEGTVLGMLRSTDADMAADPLRKKAIEKLNKKLQVQKVSY